MKKSLMLVALISSISLIDGQQSTLQATLKNDSKPSTVTTASTNDFNASAFFQQLENSSDRASLINGLSPTDALTLIASNDYTEPNYPTLIPIIGTTISNNPTLLSSLAQNYRTIASGDDSNLGKFYRSLNPSAQQQFIQKLPAPQLEEDLGESISPIFGIPMKDIANHLTASQVSQISKIYDDNGNSPFFNPIYNLLIADPENVSNLVSNSSVKTLNATLQYASQDLKNEIYKNVSPSQAQQMGISYNTNSNSEVENYLDTSKLPKQLPQNEKTINYPLKR